MATDLAYRCRHVVVVTFPQCIGVGADLTVIHNDAYLALLGQKSAAQGESFDQLWRDAWDHMGALCSKPWKAKAVWWRTPS